MRIILYISILNLLCIQGSSCNRNATIDTLYIDKILYNKMDSLAFSGVLNVVENGEKIMRIKFSNGLPQGKWEGYYENSNKIQFSGIYYSKDILSRETLNLIQTDTLAINYYKEGPNAPLIFSVEIIEPNNINISTNVNSSLLLQKIANSVYRDTKNKFTYDYLQLCYEDAIYLNSKYYIREYKISNNEPIDTGIIRKSD